MRNIMTKFMNNINQYRTTNSTKVKVTIMGLNDTQRASSNSFCESHLNNTFVLKCNLAWYHNDAIRWRHFPYRWSYVRGTHPNRASNVESVSMTWRHHGDVVPMYCITIHHSSDIEVCWESITLQQLFFSMTMITRRHTGNTRTLINIAYRDTPETIFWHAIFVLPFKIRWIIVLAFHLTPTHRWF